MKYIFLIYLLISQPLFAFENFVTFDGPNCLNAALVYTGLLPAHRYSANSEMMAYMQSPLCSLVTSEELNAGDIGLIYNLGTFAQPGIISHAFIYLDKVNSFEKVGFSKLEPYHLVETQKILDDYEVLNLTSKALKFYRCKENSKLNESVEEILSSAISTKDNFSQVHKQIMNIVESEIPTEENSAQLVSIIYQLHILGDSKYYEAIKNNIYNLNNIKDVFRKIKKLR